jgi:hypothetical protein
VVESHRRNKMEEIKYDRKEGRNSAEKVCLPEGGLEDLFSEKRYYQLKLWREDNDGNEQ